MESKDAKKALRSQIRRARRERANAPDAASARERAAQALAEAVLRHLDETMPLAQPAPGSTGEAAQPLPRWGQPGATVALFRSTPTEPPTHALSTALLERGVRVLVPRTLPDLDLDWHELLPGTLHEPPMANLDGRRGSAAAKSDAADLPGGEDRDDEGPALGVEAIGRASVVLTPGLAVDASGHRLGQGGGCYDRALQRRADGAPVATILFDDELVAALPHEPHDSPVDAVVTPSRGWTVLPIGPDHLGN
ncbi:5-formyltetrahydrofolate cyclo-ligase [Gephyromycinifex aptenodytis]|uniref:5-formyltetrahydrofolate cyclo-ligase n=1 Tax=Gephyromycinifex aptenodytis TaxID=2716227 RepID=UPI001446A12A|nr:5-formyltetrahydrofolate cyclo-ligase [Gephyromycinifex aptenodytis]